MMKRKKIIAVGVLMVLFVMIFVYLPLFSVVKVKYQRVTGGELVVMDESSKYYKQELVVEDFDIERLFQEGYFNSNNICFVSGSIRIEKDDTLASIKVNNIYKKELIVFTRILVVILTLVVMCLLIDIVFSR